MVLDIVVLVVSKSVDDCVTILAVVDRETNELVGILVEAFSCWETLIEYKTRLKMTINIAITMKPNLRQHRVEISEFLLRKKYKQTFKYSISNSESHTELAHGLTLVLLNSNLRE